MGMTIIISSSKKIFLILILVLSFNTIVSSQIVEISRFKKNTHNIGFPIYYRTVTNDSTVKVYVKPLFGKYHQCIIKTTHVDNDTLFVELINTAQIIEENDRFSITVEKYVCHPAFFFVKVVTNSISFKICKIVIGENGIVFLRRPVYLPCCGGSALRHKIV